MRKLFIFLTAAVFSFTHLPSALYAESVTPEPYEKDEFPSWAYDIRRTEIITFGSLPFVTIGVTLIYGTTLYLQGDLKSFPNPLDKSSDSFTSEQQFKIFMTSLGVSCALGATDYIISMIQHRNKKKRIQEIEERSKKIRIDPYIFTPLYELEENQEEAQEPQEPLDEQVESSGN